jgi:putative PEP-CTERM system histidine kinase
MNLIDIIQILFTVLGLFTAIVIFLFRRFGPPSWLLSCYLLLCSIGTGAGTYVEAAHLIEWPFRLMLASLLLAAPFGLSFSWALNRPLYQKIHNKRKTLIPLIFLPAPILAASLWALKTGEISSADGSIATGPVGYLASLYLVILSVLALSSLEQIIRGADERVRWQIKFLVIGLAGANAAAVYVASKSLLYSFRYAPLYKSAFDAFALLFPISCLFILASWRRSTGNERTTVSQRLVYSSITFLSVGIYLIVSAALSSWIGFRGLLGMEAQSVVFLLSIIGLATVLLWTSFRHRVRDWIRRNVFAGKYDYRELWTEASDRIRSTDGVESSALALASLIQRALGAIHIGIWLYDRNPDKARLAGFLGDVEYPQNQQIKEILEKFIETADPITVEEIAKKFGDAELNEFCRKSNAALLVPLRSSGRFIGVITIGSDRSGRPYNWEARDFLRVLANHAASEFHKHELLSTLVAAKEAEAFKSFSTFLLHDLKNFASTLSLIAKNASRHQAKPEFQRDAFKSIFEIAEKMKRLCNNLRAFSSSLAANKKEADLNEIVRATVEGLDAGTLRRIHLDLGDLPPVHVDGSEMTKVVQNLVLNANEAMSAAGSISIKTSARNGHVELIVQDNGRGMTREFLEKELFLPFHTTKSDGLGIGLFQCKKIVEAHEGRIFVKSEEGQGTVVSIAIPVMASSQARP